MPTIRPARREECGLLTELALRSKAVWGYDAAFMEACREELTIRREMFDSEADDLFMTKVVPVKQEFHQRLPAITHVDGTARIHTVREELNPLYHRMITEFAKLRETPHRGELEKGTPKPLHAPALLIDRDESIGCVPDNARTQLGCLLEISQIALEKDDSGAMSPSQRFAHGRRQRGSFESANDQLSAQSFDVVGHLAAPSIGR